MSLSQIEKRKDEVKRIRKDLEEYFLVSRDQREQIYFGCKNKPRLSRVALEDVLEETKSILYDWKILFYIKNKTYCLSPIIHFVISNLKVVRLFIFLWFKIFSM